MYKSSDLKKLRKTATRLSAMITADIYGKAEAIDKRKFAKHLGTIEDFLQSSSSIRGRLWTLAGIETKHINEQEARKKLEEL